MSQADQVVQAYMRDVCGLAVIMCERFDLRSEEACMKIIESAFKIANAYAEHSGCTRVLNPRQAVSLALTWSDFYG